MKVAIHGGTGEPFWMEKAEEAPERSLIVDIDEKLYENYKRIEQEYDDMQSILSDLQDQAE